MVIKQILYNVFDSTNGQYFSTSSDKNSIINSSEINYESNKINIFENILSENEKVSKIGIQAPPGTTVILNDKNIKIGKSGIYELEDEDIIITSIKFQQEKRMIVDENYNRQKIEEAEEKLWELQFDSSTSSTINQLIDKNDQYTNSYLTARKNYEKSKIKTFIQPTDLNNKIKSFKNIEDLPSEGNPNFIYSIELEKKSYGWNNRQKKYVLLDNYYEYRIYKEEDNYIKMKNIILDFIIN